MATSQPIKNQQRSYEVFEKKHYMECTTLCSAAHRTHGLCGVSGSPQSSWVGEGDESTPVHADEGWTASRRGGTRGCTKIPAKAVIGPKWSSVGAENRVQGSEGRRARGATALVVCAR